MLAEHKSINFMLRRLKIKERQNPNIMVKITLSRGQENSEDSADLVWFTMLAPVSESLCPLLPGFADK